MRNALVPRSVVSAAVIFIATVTPLASFIVPAHDGPGIGNCGFNPVCLLIPGLPELDHDIDLTKNPGDPQGSAGAADISPAPGGGSG